MVNSRIKLKSSIKYIINSSNIDIKEYHRLTMLFFWLFYLTLLKRHECLKYIIFINFKENMSWVRRIEGRHTRQQLYISLPRVCSSTTGSTRSRKHLKVAAAATTTFFVSCFWKRDAISEFLFIKAQIVKTKLNN